MKNKYKKFMQQLNLAISENPEILEVYIDTNIEPAGNDYRLNPAPCCGHNDCATITPGFPIVNCFSATCDRKYCLVEAILEFRKDKNKTKAEIISELAQRFSITPPVEDSAYEVTQRIRKDAADFFHQQLLQNKEAYDYLINTRKRNPETIKKMRLGLGGNSKLLGEKLFKQDFKPDEIRANREFFIAEGLLTFPYIDPETGDILRVNTKNPFSSQGNQHRHSYSAGKKALYLSPGLSHNNAIVVEGEHDLMALMEQGAPSVVALGGNPSKEEIEELAKFNSLHLMLDNDNGGKEMTKRLNEELPHIPVSQIQYNAEFKDPDEYYRDCPEPISIEDLIAQAKPLDTDKHRVIYQKGAWHLETRTFRLELKDIGRNKSGEFTGNIQYIKSGEQTVVAYGEKLTRYKQAADYGLKFQITLEEIYDSGFEEKSLDELVRIYTLSRRQEQIIPAMARKFSKNEDRDSVTQLITKKLGQTVLDRMLQEANEQQNIQVISLEDITKMKVSQFFDPKKDDAYFYYTYNMRDGDTIKKLPYLLSNKMVKLRLDLIRRKDDNSLLLVDGKYELPEEIRQEVGDAEEISLTYHWVEKFVNDLVKDEELDITLLVSQLEAFIKRFYYHKDERLFKVLALWIYGTYYYELFMCYPYLYLNGKKGSGKSRMDMVLKMFSFNPKYAVNITSAALFRMIDTVGGTVIIDEIENITDRAKAQDSDLATVLKAGYEVGPKAYRAEGDGSSGFSVKGFSLYSPKVISNIFGIEDVIADRCVPINTYEVKGIELEDPKMYFVERREEFRELTSKCCLSALKHFQEVYKLFREVKFDGVSARVSQIMKPLATLAKIAGKEYEDALMGYYQVAVVDAKLLVEDGTPEGTIVRTINEVALELLGRLKPNHTDTTDSKFVEKIILGEGYFEITDLHLKVWIEEQLPGQTISMKDMNSWIKRVVNFNAEGRRRSKVTIFANAFREFKENSRINVYWYRFYYKDIVPDYESGQEKREPKKVEKTIDDF